MVNVSRPGRAGNTAATTETNIGGQRNNKSQVNNHERTCTHRLALVFLTLALADWIAKLSLPQVGRAAGPRSTAAEEDKINYTHYIPAAIEGYVVENADSLGYNSEGDENPPSCGIWNSKNSRLATIRNDLDAYRAELVKYKELVDKFSTNITDLRKHLDDGGGRGGGKGAVCDRLEPHPGGLKSIFSSGQLSYSSSGFVEPLLPPMRHPEFCFDRKKYLMDLGYIVHDFAAMCRKLKKTSRTVLVDMGPDLDFSTQSDGLAVYLLDTFNRFGFKFDHIYAYEKKHHEAAHILRNIPEKFLPAYHWINVAVARDPESPMNPLRMILNNYDEDDLVIVKMDVDVPDIEIALAEQLASDHRFDKLIDQFYFEHHVHIQELAIYWTDTMRGNAKASMDLFSTLRRKGIPAHFWV